MKIIGANICVKPSGDRLRDAGACLLIDGQLMVAIAEERITRVKHDYTIRNSIHYCLNACGVELDDIDLFVFSICGAKPLTAAYAHQFLSESGMEVPLSKIIVNPSHHLAHAASAFFSSGFSDSLIMVADRDGSILAGNEPETHANSVEHLSYYAGKDTDITLLERDDDVFGDLGVGMGYSYVTEWLGFDGHAMAGKTMALAAYGKSGALEPAHFYEFRDNKIHCLLEPTDFNKTLSVRRLIFNKTGKDIGAHCTNLDSEDAFNVSRLIQDDLETVVLQKLRYLKEKTGLRNLCFAGGVALNCRLNYMIHKSGLFENIFIQPAAGDTGQCLGNALYAYHMVCRMPRSFIMSHSYYGRAYSTKEVEDAIHSHLPSIVVEKPTDMYDRVSQQLYDGAVVAWYQGKSEFGPRALGNRSILASPLFPDMKNRLNEYVKFREWFRPYGICVKEECTSDYFDFNGCNPYMLIAPMVLNHVKSIIPSAIHVDGSSRIQTVDDTNGKLYALLTAFQKKTGIPILINTSFNIKGEPIVESPEDAMNCFLATEIDCLVLHDYLIFKR